MLRRVFLYLSTQSWAYRLLPSNPLTPPMA